MRDYKKLVAALVAAWFIVVAGVSGLGLYRTDTNRIGIAVAVSALAPILAFVLWYTFSGGFRRFALSLNARTLTFAQSWRLAGIFFVILQANGVLPALFGLPAGIGDMAVGATAPLVASRLARREHRRSFTAWQWLGIADLVMAVTLGTTARMLSPASVSMAPMTVLPLSLVPTFIVPLLLIFHLISIAQARTWNVDAEPAPARRARDFMAAPRHTSRAL